MLWATAAAGARPVDAQREGRGRPTSPFDPALCSGSTPTTEQDVAVVETGFFQLSLFGRKWLDSHSRAAIAPSQATSGPDPLAALKTGPAKKKRKLVRIIHAVGGPADGARPVDAQREGRGRPISPLDPALCSGSIPTNGQDVAVVEVVFLSFRFLGESDLAACRGRLSLFVKRHPHSAERQAACTCRSREAPALWKCRACGCPADVVLGESGIHRPLEISRPRWRRCRSEAARFPHSHRAR